MSAVNSFVCADCGMVYETRDMGAYVYLMSGTWMGASGGGGGGLPRGVCPECQRKRDETAKKKRAEDRKLSLLMQRALEHYKDEEAEPVSVVYCRQCEYLGFDPSTAYGEPWFYCGNSGDLDAVTLDDYCSRAKRGAPKFVEEADGE